MTDWNGVKLDDSAWESAATFDPPKVTTSAQMVEPNRILETLRPVKIDKTPDGGWLIDMGKNYTGWLELRLPAGTTAGKNLKIEFADNPPAGGRYGTYQPARRIRDPRGARTRWCARASTTTLSATPTSLASTRRPPPRTCGAISCAPATGAPANSSRPTTC